MEDKQKDAILIEFDTTGSVFFDIKVQGTVFPQQLILIGEHIKNKGIDGMRITERRQAELEAANRIVKPEKGLVIPK